MSRTWSSGSLLGEALDDREQHVGPFDQLRLEPLAPTYPVLLERADDEGGDRQIEPRARCEPRGVVPRAEHVDVDADRDAVHLLRRDPGRRHERLHLAVRHLDAVDLGVTRAHRLEAGVELGHARRPRTPVEVRQAEVVPRPLEVVQQQRELAQVEDRLVRDAARPPPRPQVDAERGGGAGQVPRLVGEHPLRRLLLDEQPRMGRPVSSAKPDSGAPKRPADGRGETPRMSRHVHRHRSRQ